MPALKKQNNGDKRKEFFRRAAQEDLETGKRITRSGKPGRPVPFPFSKILRPPQDLSVMQAGKAQVHVARRRLRSKDPSAYPFRPSQRQSRIDSMERRLGGNTF